MSYFVIEIEDGFFYERVGKDKTTWFTQDPEKAYRYESASDAARDCGEGESVSEVDRDGNVRGV